MHRSVMYSSAIEVCARHARWWSGAEREESRDRHLL